ncbi:MAG: hypothetical protein M1548_07645 [Actinobacteria bacterium]|nr:hypothetical protein [Actinomycetota bacterium]
MVYVLTFNIAPGRADDFWYFMDKKAAPFWRGIAEVSSVKVFSVVGGPHRYEAHFEMPNLAAYDQIRNQAEWSNISREFLTLVEDVDQRFLTDERNYLEVRRAA